MCSENPFDISNFFRANGTSFHAKAVFSRENGKEKNGKPLAGFNHFSRVVITIIDKDTKAKYCEANIQYDNLAEIFERGRFAIERVLNNKNRPADVAGSDTNSPAYTVFITSGKLKGKSPAQVMLEMGEEGAKLLNNQYKFLQDNLAKFPKNKEQMDAIAEAASLYKAGKLKKTETAAVGGVIPILEAFPMPLIRKKNKDGTYPVREISIECNLAKNSPFEVNILNYDSPVKAVTGNGLTEITETEGTGGNKINVQKGEKKNEVQKKFSLTLGEFSSFLKHIEIAETIFLNNYSAVLLKEAIEADQENRKNAGVETR